MRAKNATQIAASEAVGYIRVSTDEQSLSVEAQRKRLVTWCTDQGLILVAVHEDVGISGGAELVKRPALMQALDSLQAGRVLVAVKRDRLARDTINAAIIERMAERVGATIQTCDGVGVGNTPEAKLIRQMIDAFAEYERQIIRARTRIGMAHKRDKGERISRRVPYGMQLSTDGVHLEVNPTEQATIALAQKYAARDISARQIAVKLAAKGHYSREGTTFAHSAILAMVRK